MSFTAIYFTLSLLSLLFVFCAIVPGRRLYILIIFYFFIGWLTSELALWHLGLQLVFSLMFISTGGLDTTTGQWGLAFFALSWLGLIYLHVQAMDTGSILERALREGLGDNYRSQIPADRHAVLRNHIKSSEWLKPFNMQRMGVTVHRELSYGDAGKRNLLDVYQPDTPREDGFPILLQVHGGGWMIGEKEQQALPLMYHLAQRGWLCVSCNYRLSPNHSFPAHIIDVKKTIAWIREHAAEYGGNADFLAITGGSAGGHLSSLAALTPNKAEWQPGFEEADTSISAAIPLYGVYDFLDRENLKGSMSLETTLEKYIFKSTREEGYDARDEGSPLSQVTDQAPPMFVVQGTHDSLVWVEEAHAFVDKMKLVSQQAVVFGELPGAQHAFDVFHSVRTDHTVNAATDFLEWCYARRSV